MAGQAIGGMRTDSAHGHRVGRVFVGREDELAELVEALDAASAGQGSCRLIAGEPGIGKSRLVDELADIARSRGTRVLWGRAWEAGGAPAYWPWIQSLRPIVRQAVRASEVSGERVALIAQLFPEIQDERAVGRLNLDEEGVRFRLFEAVGELLRSAAGRQPILLILEDADAADTPSHLLLRFIGGVVAQSHVLLLVTYRDVTLGREHPLRAVIAALLRHPSTFRHTLAGLTTEDVRRYLDVALDGAAPPELVDTIHRETEGNPLFVAEVARLYAAQPGELADPRRLARLVIPETVREVIERRLEPVSDQLRDVLAAAAVLGRDFSVDVLGALTGVPTGDLLALLDKAVEARLIGEPIDTPGRFRFAHVLIRDTLYEGLRPSRRLALHLAAAGAFEARVAAGSGSHLTEVAHHYLLAGPAGAADVQIASARRAADQAVAVLAYEEAGRLLQEAIAVLVRHPDDELRCRLFLELGDVRARAGDAPAAREAFLAAVEVARRLRLTDLEARAALGYGGRFVWEAGRGDPHLVPLLRGALEALGDRDEHLRVKLLARLAGGPLRDDPDREERDRLSDQALALARGKRDPALLAYALNARYAATWWPDNLAQRLELARELVSVSREAGDREHELQAHHYLCLALLETGDISGAHGEAAEQRRLADELRQPAQSFYVATVEAMLATLEGHFTAAEELVERAHAQGARAEPAMARIYRAIQSHALARARGKLSALLPELRAVADRYPSYVVLRCVLVDALREAGRTDEAGAELRALAADGLARLPLNDEWIFAMCLLGETAVDLSLRGEVEVVRAQLEPYRGRVAVSPPDSCLGAVDRVLGLLDHFLGNAAEARGHLQAAIALNEALGSPHWTAETRLVLANVLLAGGNAEASLAQSMLHDVARVGRELGMPTLERRALAALASMGTPPSGERVIRTFMFTDIVRSTDLIEAIGDEAWEDVLGWHDRTLRRLLKAHGSVHVEHRGDGFFAVFEDATTAISCAQEIQVTLAVHRRAEGFAPAVRIGIHAASARLVGAKYAGQGVHAAARIASLAGPGEIVASLGSVTDLPRVGHGEARSERLKGVRDPIPVVRIVLPSGEPA